MRNRKHKVYLILTVLIGILLMSGCGGKDSGAPKDGEYKANVTLEGGSGRASVQSPAAVKVEDGQACATIIWDSINYDYMLVDDKKYLNENKGGNSTFTIPVSEFESKIPVIGDTTAMSTPYEIEYTLYFELVD